MEGERKRPGYQEWHNLETVFWEVRCDRSVSVGMVDCIGKERVGLVGVRRGILEVRGGIVGVR